MNSKEIIDTDGNKINVNGIYYISNNNNYYFIYTKKEQDSENHIIFYVVKILQEVVNGENGPTPTGYLLGVKINDDNEYDLVKKDIISILNDKENNTESVRYLDLAMLDNLKIKDTRTFKLSVDIYNKMFSNNNEIEEDIEENENDTSDVNNNINVEELIRENEKLKQEIAEYKRKFSLINEIVN